MSSPIMTPSELGASPGEARLRDHAERNLGALVVAIEFTLISVMVGVILFPLMDSATPLLRDLKIEYWPYILSGLLLILYLWAEVISHSLSFIGWPINIGHNLLYIVFAMLLAIQMHFLSDPRAWFVMSLINAAISTMIVYYDLYVIQEREVGASGAAAELFQFARRRQWGIVRLAPFNIGNAALHLGLVLVLPGIFIERPGHLILVGLQIVALAYFTWRSIANFRSWRGQIVARVMEELASGGEV